jgi:ABC-type antimicrobial peptide transport system permease subunit
LVTLESLMLVVAGIALGLPAAFALTQLVAGSLYGVGSMDSASIAIAVLVLVLVTAFARVIPARRAPRVDPMVALRVD